MTDLPLLTLILAIPAIGALILVAFLRGEDEAAALNAKRLGLLVTTFTFVLSLPLMTDFDPNDTGFQFVEEGVWFGGLSYKLGIDGISMPFVMLTTFFFPLVIAASWHVEHRVKEYIAAFLALEALIIGVFVSLDMILFYLFFEGGLIPMFLIIGIWGGKERIYAAFKFFLYTLLGSLLML
ncbi:MAG: proton-conducting transporter membrane subunit, partial [Pseudomonadota bacterium]